ncbi:PRC-barrel domain-containing protein [Candidatus Symbiobacter mobilis]|uniref:PRC-barrel domain protein n=1 Tax=Candidatus Symbiobacter mobilis CR TaxID=946483 RepID=U5NBA5_9BURK|nr:PRC-barrel domain-containing protein [Candidatus Symbiobacter mobilis]AGX87523.1 PRC-barrel domain protein [Candidatus Symbiobacter mobilis CR]
MKNPLLLSALLAAATLTHFGLAQSQVAGSTTIGITVTEATQVAMGWSVTKSLLGKTVHNESGEKIGEVIDLIIAPDRNLSFVIVGAGGFIGIGRHDVAIPVSQIQNHGDKLIMPGATKDAIKAMPTFNYASDTARRDQFIADAEHQMARARDKVTELLRRAGEASAESKAVINRDIDQLQLDLKYAQEKLDHMKRVGAANWHDFESDVNAAIVRLRKALEAA